MPRDNDPVATLSIWNTSKEAMETIHREYEVDKTKIGFIRFIFEAYEGVAIATTLDAQKGHLRLAIAPGREKTVAKIVDDLKKDFLFRAV